MTIVAQRPSESLAPLQGRKLREYRRRAAATVSKSLMISLSVEMGHVLGDRVLKRWVSEEDHPIQELVLRAICIIHELSE